MTRTVQYGKQTAQVRSAAGVSGVLCRSAVDGAWFFRVYGEDGAFTDYALRHDELAVTIGKDELASFYLLGNQGILDHSPAVLGLKHTARGKL